MTFHVLAVDGVRDFSTGAAEVRWGLVLQLNRLARFLSWTKTRWPRIAIFRQASTLKKTTFR